MAVGTSLGTYYDDAFQHTTAQWDPKYENEANLSNPQKTPDTSSRFTSDQGMVKSPLEVQDTQNVENNIQSPKELAANKAIASDPKNITDDQGNIVDYSMPKEPFNLPAEPDQDKLAPSFQDYDYDSWRKANPNAEMKPGQHYPDTYKLPNHMTFSDESIYNGVGGAIGGHWDQDENDKWTFTAGPTNLQYHSKEELQDYFKKVEPDSKLIIPQDKDLPGYTTPIADVRTDRNIDLKPFQSPYPYAGAESGGGEGSRGGKGGYTKFPIIPTTPQMELDQLQETRALNKRMGYDVNSPDYKAYNDRIKELQDIVSKPESVKSAALQYKGETIEGVNHGDALNTIMSRQGGIPESDFAKIKEGFTTTKGRFVSREEAFDIAKERDQIDQKTLDSLTAESKMLLSEDLK
jgi:hypothetical protein